LSDPLWYSIRPDTRLQTKGCKNRHVHPAAWNFVHWLALLQLLYRWQYQYRRLWMQPRNTQKIPQWI
jgi:hypothetical protein